MTGWICLGAAALLVVLLFLPVGLAGAYQDERLSLRARIGPVSLQLYPRREKGAPAAPRRRKRKDGGGKEAREGQPLSPAQALELARALLPDVLELAGRFRRRLRVPVLEVEAVIGSSDPGRGAMAYGWLNGAVGALWGPLNGAFRIGDGRISLRPELERDIFVLNVRAELRIRVGQLLWLGLTSGTKLMRTFLTLRKRQKANDRKAA